MNTTKPTALLIDNGRVDVRPVHKTLEQGGFECMTSDLGDALYRFYTSKPDLLVLVSPGDESLPILLAAQGKRKSPTIALVSDADAASAEWAREMEVDACLTIDDPGLSKRVVALLGEDDSGRNPGSPGASN